MPIEIMALCVTVPIDPINRRHRPGRRKAAVTDRCEIKLEVWDNCFRVWDNVDFTVCGDGYYFDPAEANPIITNGKTLIDMPYFSEVFRYLTDAYAANRKDSIGECLKPAIAGMERALAEKEGTSVYFAEADQRIKIGWSRKVATRVAQLQTGSAAPIKLLGTIPGGRSKERELHERFADARIGGEWFMATPELLDFICTLCRVQERQSA